MDTSNMNRPEYDNSGEFCPICTTLSDAAEVLHTADRIPDEATKDPLIEGAKKMVQNVLDALNGRRTEGLVTPDEDDD